MLSLLLHDWWALLGTSWVARGEVTQQRARDREVELIVTQHHALNGEKGLSPQKLAVMCDTSWGAMQVEVEEMALFGRGIRSLGCCAELERAVPVQSWECLSQKPGSTDVGDLVSSVSWLQALPLFSLFLKSCLSAQQWHAKSHYLVFVLKHFPSVWLYLICVRSIPDSHNSYPTDQQGWEFQSIWDLQQREQLGSLVLQVSPNLLISVTQAYNLSHLFLQYQFSHAREPLSAYQMGIALHGEPVPLAEL